MKNYLRNGVHKILSEIKVVHEKIKDINLNDLDDLEQDMTINPYQALRFWLVDYVLVLGTLTTIPFIAFTHSQNPLWIQLLYPLCFGCVWWLAEQAIRRYTENRR